METTRNKFFYMKIMFLIAVFIVERLIFVFMKKVSIGIFHISRLFIRFCLGKVKFTSSIGFDGLTVKLEERKKVDKSNFEAGFE